MKSSIEKAILVNVPVRTAYNQWTQFEEFPRFMEGVRAVAQLDDKTLHFRATIAGKDESWLAEIIEQQPDTRIVWRSRTGARNDGSVTFEKIDERHTRISLTIGYEPAGVLESVGDKLGFVSRRVEGDLRRFKEFIERQGEETGAWRGELGQGAHP